MKILSPLIILILCVVVFQTSRTNAQININTNVLQGSDLLAEVRTGVTSVTDAASQLSEQANISIPDARSIITNLQDEVNSAAGQLIDGVVSGVIPPEVGRVLSLRDDLGQLLDPEEIQEIFQLDAIQDAIKEKIDGAIDGITGGLRDQILPSEITDMIGSITSIVGDIENLDDAAKEYLTNAIMDNIPDLDALTDLFGGFEGLFSSIFGSLDSNSITNELGPGATGDYETFERDPKSEAVSDGINPDCRNCTCKTPIQNNHKTIRAHVTDEFIPHRTWVIDEIFTKHILPAMMLMSEQLTNISIQQIQMIGGFFDAKQQLELQRLMQIRSAKTHQNYQMSEGICEIGTGALSLAASEKKSDLAKVTINNRFMNRQLRSADALSSIDRDSDIYNRAINFIYKYCDKADNTGGLDFLCNNGGNKPTQKNKDINFTGTVETELTLDVDFLNPPNPDDSNNTDQEDIFALSANLFSHEPIEPISDALLATAEGQPRAMALRYMDLRSIAAKRSVATNSYSSILSKRVSGDQEVAPYLKRIVTELGVPDEDVEEILGEAPSYFAQTEVLTKDIFQNPVFYTELYDKPANVLRKSAAIRALNLMQERDLYESQLRSEAVLSVMLETMLDDEQRRVEALMVDLDGGEN